MNKKKIVYVVTSPMSAGTLLCGQLSYLRQQGWDVVLVCGSSSEVTTIAAREGVRAVVLPLSRRPNPLQDLRVLVALSRLLKLERPEIVNFSTPKAGLLASMAASWQRIPVKVYVLRGLRYEGLRGLARWGMRTLEQIPCRLADEVLCVSHSLRAQAIADHLASPDKLTVLGNGSSNGVNLERFDRRMYLSSDRDSLKRSLGIPVDAVVFGFVGRIVRDKGIIELAEAFRELKKHCPSVALVIVGPLEEGSKAVADWRKWLREDPDVYCVGEQSAPEHYYAVMDVLVLPSYREGFPNVALEAAAMSVAVITTSATGCRDAVIDEVSGTIVPIRDSSALFTAMLRYCQEAEIATRQGAEGRRVVEDQFEQGEFWKLLEEKYVSLCAAVDQNNTLRVANRGSFARRVSKRVFDFVLAAFLLCILCPVLLAIGLGVYLRLGRPILFRQWRPGLNGKPFLMNKFRTMKQAFDRHGKALPDEQRLSRFGSLLRNLSLDELPELWNILKGEMSFVGPRPLLTEYLQRYSSRQAMRHDVKPGLTGWAQIHGRNAISWEEKFELDLWYVENQSFWLDLQILWMTFWTVLKRDGISADSHVSMPEFLGEAEGSEKDNTKSSIDVNAVSSAGEVR